MRSSALRGPTASPDLGRMLERWSSAGNTTAISALCEQIASTNIALLESTFFSLLDRDEPALAATLDLMCAAISRARRRQEACVQRG